MLRRVRNCLFIIIIIIIKWNDEDFCLAQVTDRPNPQLLENAQHLDDPVDRVDSHSAANPPAVDSQSTESTPVASHSGQPTDHNTAIVTTSADSQAAITSTPIVTPHSVRPLPEAPARQEQRKSCRKKLSSTILTNTPVKESIRKQQNERTEKR